MSLILNDLRRQVIRRSTQRPRNIWHHFCEPKVGDFDVPQVVNEQVLGFQVAVDNVTSVEVFECCDNFGGIEPCYVVRKTL